MMAQKSFRTRKDPWHPASLSGWGSAHGRCQEPAEEPGGKVTPPSLASAFTVGFLVTLSPAAQRQAGCSPLTSDSQHTGNRSAGATSAKNNDFSVYCSDLHKLSSLLQKTLCLLLPYKMLLFKDYSQINLKRSSDLSRG